MMDLSRRDFLKLTGVGAAAALLGPARSLVRAPSSVLADPMHAYKGACVVPAEGPDNETVAGLLENLGCRWYYDWGIDASKIRSTPPYYLPMIPHVFNSGVEAVMTQIINGGYVGGWWLGINEPDNVAPYGRDLTVEQCVDVWKAASDCILGTPGNPGLDPTAKLVAPAFTQFTGGFSHGYDYGWPQYAQAWWDRYIVKYGVAPPMEAWAIHFYPGATNYWEQEHQNPGSPTEFARRARVFTRNSWSFINGLKPGTQVFLTETHGKWGNREFNRDYMNILMPWLRDKKYCDRFFWFHTGFWLGWAGDRDGNWLYDTVELPTYPVTYAYPKTILGEAYTEF